jgi:hypothetical protein
MILECNAKVFARRRGYTLVRGPQATSIGAFQLIDRGGNVVLGDKYDIGLQRVLDWLRGEPVIPKHQRG